MLLALMLSGCSILSEMISFSQCEFRLATVENITLAGVNVQHIHKLSDLSLLDAGRISAALISGPLPLSLTLNVDVRNPNQQQASMNRLDWILLIDGQEIVQGSSGERLSIPPNNGTGTLPLHITADLKSALSGHSGEALLNFGLNLAGAGNTLSRITLRANPYIVVGGRELSYPSFIDIENEFVSR